MAEAKLSKLKVKRNTLLAQQQRVKDFVDTKLDKASLYELETRLQALDKYYNDFQSIQSAIEEAEDPSTDDKYRAPYEELYFVLRPALLLRLADIKKSAKEETSSDDVANQFLSSSSPLRLPKINLPTFSGDYTQWTSYYETFSALVIRNPGLDNVTRFHYLRSSLKDGALRRIESIEVTDENYEVALKLLVDRYQRKNVIVREHVRHLFNITPIAQKASATALRDLIDSFNVHLRALTTLGRPVAHWDDIIIEIVLQKLDHLTLDKWNDECPVDRIPTVEELFKFLERRCSHLEERSLSRPKVGSQASNNQTNARTAVNKIVLTSSKQSTPKIPSTNKSTALSAISLSESKDLANRGTPIVILATALIYIQNQYGSTLACRALLDSGSQLNFITEQMAAHLGIRRQRSNVNLSGIGSSTLFIRHSITTTIKSRTSSFTTQLEFLIMPQICDQQPEIAINVSNWVFPAQIELADTEFFKPHKIDVLIGAEVFGEILLQQQLRFSSDMPLLQNTVFGWVVIGKIMTRRCSLQCSRTPTVNSLETIIRQFWELESHISSCKPLTIEEKSCEDHYLAHIARSDEGRFVVRLPLKQPSSVLGESLSMAKRRLISVERRLMKNPQIYNEYATFMTEYETLSHMTKIGTVSDVLPPCHYFLPHHCVIKAESSSTRLRVVFDASAKSSSNISLNDILMIGPTVQSDLFTVMTRFRAYRYVFTCDITKMYRQIEVAECDRNLQLILWRTNSNDEMKVYRLNTVTYGTASAPYLATRCLRKFAEDEKIAFPLASKALQYNTYVDDIMTGADNIDEAKKLLKELTDMLSTAKFQLRKYCSNHTNILSMIPEKDREPFLNISGAEVVCTLGIIWQPDKDVFRFNFSFEDTIAPTKRTVLSDLGKIFDPLGFIGPIVVLGKIFLQQLWKQQISWDQPLPDESATTWRTFIRQLSELNALCFDRRLINLSHHASAQIHAFSDSSEKAYGTCVYLRSADSKGNISVSLICSKSRVAPAKSISIAKLELQAALLMTELVERLMEILPFYIHSRHFYTDSKIVLAWVAKPSYTWTTFVANRVAKIQDLTRLEEWHYVPTDENPADLISRGMLPKDFALSQLWKNGPLFLSNSVIEQQVPPADDTIIPEQRTAKSILTASKSPFTELIKTTNIPLHKLIRIFAYCFRFKTNSKVAKGERLTDFLKIHELRAALNGIIINAQRSYLWDDYIHLVKNMPLSNGSKLRTLSPYLEEGIIRVGGRLQNSNLTYHAKHPIVLPQDSNFTKVLAINFHIINLHAGPQTLLCLIRQQYWPINGKQLCKNVVHRCIKCFRTKPSKTDTLMGNLPSERVVPGRAFLTVGIDFCGPVMVHSNIRGRAPNKAYLAIFVCFTTKAVHIEVVSDLSTAAFIAALRRFIARRGICKTIISDNATNFIGAKNELADLARHFNSDTCQKEVINFCQQNLIEWRTIPPRSPHFGGLWEAAVKQAKYHIIRVIANAKLSFEELTTITAQIESILNSRPLTPLTSDPADLQALTPGHFLIGEPLTSFPEPDITDYNYNRLHRFKRLQQLQQIFWRRWSTEYLHLLQQRYKWQSKNSNITPNTLVLVQEENQPPYKWPLARVLKTLPGRDGVARVAEIKTQHGVYQRAIAKLYPLPVDN